MKIFTSLIFILLSFFSKAQTRWNSVSDENFNFALETLFSDSASDKLYIGGLFKFYNQQNYNGIAFWNGNEILNLDCGLGGCASNRCGGVIQFEKYKNELYALFREDSIGCQQINHLAKWDGSSWITLNQTFYWQGLSMPIYFMTIIDSSLIVTGDFDSVSTKHVQGITKYDGLVWDTVFSCPLFTDDYLLIHPLIKYNNIVYAQNYLVDTLGNRQFFSSWNGQCWEKMPGVFSNPSGSIRKMIVYKNELYVAGAFDPNHDPMAPSKSIARWNGTRWDDLNGGVVQSNPAYTAAINDMAIYNDELYVVGNFQRAGILPAYNVAKWNGSAWCTLTTPFSDDIMCLAFYHDSLFVGGNFKTIGNDSILYLAKCAVTAFDTCEFNISVEEIDNGNLRLFPIPSVDKIMVELNYKTIQNISIYDLTGKLVKAFSINTSNQELDISTLSPGLYFLDVVSDQRTFRKRFVKN